MFAGKFAGFDLYLRPSFNDTTEMVVRGNNSYGARVTDTALGTIRSLEATVQGFDERAERLALDITDANKRIKELGEKVGAKFEREERFQELYAARVRLRRNWIDQEQAPSQVVPTTKSRRRIPRCKPRPRRFVPLQDHDEHESPTKLSWRLHAPAGCFVYQIHLTALPRVK